MLNQADGSPALGPQKPSAGHIPALPACWLAWGGCGGYIRSVLKE